MKTPTVSYHHVVRFMISSLRICPQFLWSGSLSLCAELALSPQSAAFMSSGSLSLFAGRRFVLHASVWTSSFGSDVSPPSVLLETMRLLVFAALFGVLLDAGRCNLERQAAAHQSACEGTGWSARPNKTGAHFGLIQYLHWCATQWKRQNDKMSCS